MNTDVGVYQSECVLGYYGRSLSSESPITTEIIYNPVHIARNVIKRLSNETLLHLICEGIPYVNYYIYISLEDDGVFIDDVPDYVMKDWDR